MLFYEPKTVVVKLETLGSGGFGNVYKGIIEVKFVEPYIVLIS